MLAVFVMPQIETKTVNSQPEGSPPQFAGFLREYFDEYFTRVLTGGGGRKQGPLRSPDLIQLFYLWKCVTQAL